MLIAYRYRITIAEKAKGIHAALNQKQFFSKRKKITLKRGRCVHFGLVMWDKAKVATTIEELRVERDLFLRCCVGAELCSLRKFVSLRSCIRRKVSGKNQVIERGQCRVLSPVVSLGQPKLLWRVWNSNRGGFRDL